MFTFNFAEMQIFPSAIMIDLLLLITEALSRQLFTLAIHVGQFKTFIERIL